MWWKICCFTGAALLWSSGMMSWAQQSTSQQPALQRDDPATSELALRLEHQASSTMTHQRGRIRYDRLERRDHDESKE